MFTKDKNKQASLYMSYTKHIKIRFNVLLIEIWKYIKYWAVLMFWCPIISFHPYSQLHQQWTTISYINSELISLGKWGVTAFYLCVENTFHDHSHFILQTIKVNIMAWGQTTTTSLKVRHPPKPRLQVI